MASADVMNKSEDQFCVINDLIDTGSQKTFLSDRLVKELNLTALSQIDRDVSTFLNTELPRIKSSEYEIVENGMIKIAIQEIEKSLAPIHRQFSAEFRFHKPNSFGQYCH